MKRKNRVALYLVVLAVVFSAGIYLTHRYFASPGKAVKQVTGLRIGEAGSPPKSVAGKELKEKQLSEKEVALMGLGLCSKKLAEGEYLDIEEFKELKSSASRWKLGLERYSKVDIDINEVAKEGAAIWVKNRITELKWLGPEMSLEQLRQIALDAEKLAFETEVDITGIEKAIVDMKKASR